MSSLAAPAPAVRPVPSLRILLALAWPLVVSRACQVVVGLFDSLMTAGLGEESLAASSTGALNSFMLVILPMGTVFIVSSFTAQLVGRGDAAGARRYAIYGLIFAFITQALVLACLPFVGSVLGWFSYAPEVRRLLGTYLAYRLLSVGAIVGIEALSNYYGGLGNTRLPMVASVITMAIDIALNYLLIRGNLGAPALGVAGAAMGSSIATFVAFFYLLVRFARARCCARFGAASSCACCASACPRGSTGSSSSWASSSSSTSSWRAWAPPPWRA
jgi:multidrug resistance protein, MATE family